MDAIFVIPYLAVLESGALDYIRTYCVSRQIRAAKTIDTMGSCRE